MARRYFDGDTDGDLTDATNYSDNTLPVNGDTLIIQATSTDITDVDLTGTNLATVIIKMGTGYYTGNLGTVAGSGVIFDCDELIIDTIGTHNNKVCKVSVERNAAGDVEVDINGSITTDSPTTYGIFLDTNSTDEMNIRINGNGVTTILASARVGDLWIGGGAASAPEVYVKGSLTTSGSLYVTAGVVENESGWTTQYAMGGTLEQLDGAPTTVLVVGGTFKPKMNTDGNTIGRIRALTGTLDCSEARKAIVVTDLDIGDADITWGNMVTLTNPATQWGKGTALQPSGSTQDIAIEV